MAANFLNTNKNANRFFFATTESGEQDLGLAFSTTGGVINLSTMSVTLSGGGGEALVNQAPQYVASEFIAADQAVITGTGSTYFTMSTLNSTLTGLNLSWDREPGYGTACIESYGGNGSRGGFEFLCRGLDSEVVSTGSVGINQYLSTLGYEGATAKLSPNGILTTSVVQGAVINSIAQAAGSGGRGCFGIFDVSGSGGANPQERWAIGTVNIPTGGDVGSDLAVFAYGDGGNFLGNAMNFERATQAAAIYNISSVSTRDASGGFLQVYPMNTTNAEFGAVGKVTTIGGACNQAVPFEVLFSTPVTNINPSGKTLLNISWEHALSTGSNLVTYKIGFSTTTAPSNANGFGSATVPGIGGTWTPSDLPGTSTPYTFFNWTGALNPYGVNPDGTANLYVLGQLADPLAPLDQIFIAKGDITNPSRTALSWRAM